MTISTSMPVPRFPDLLQLLREELSRLDASGRKIHNPAVISDVTGVSYDSIIRIRNGAPQDPGYSTVRRLADHLLTKRG